MQPRHRVSRAAIELIKRFEGYRQKAAQLPDGRWTIGHGHTRTARKGAVVSEADAEALLLYDLITVSHVLNEQIHAPLSQQQFDALASFAFNIGLDNFRRSGVLRRLNEGAPILAACAMELWRKAEVAGERIVVDALVRRRAVEKALFLTPEGDRWPTAPSHILQPLLDNDAHDVVPRQAPAEVTTALEGDFVVVARNGAPPPPPAVPEEDAEEPSPAKAAAEAVSARLSTIFAEPGEKPAPASGPSEAQPFALQPPEFDDGGDEPPEFEAEPDVESPPGPDLFAIPDQLPPPEPPAPGPRAGETAPDGPAWPGPGRERGERRIIDDAAPYDLDEPIVQPMPEPPEGGLLTLVGLAALGLVFLGGGVFWGASARPMPGPAWIDARLVGWLAGLAGALFVAIAVYLLLQRLGRATEREARNR